MYYRTTALNNVEVFQMRAPRFIDREGVSNCNHIAILNCYVKFITQILTPYSAKKAQGNALLIVSGV